MTRVIDQTEAERLLARIDVHQAMRAMFASLAEGRAVQPAQQLVEFPGGGDFINYLGVLADEGVYGIKTSPYIPGPQGATVTAWTLLMSMRSGQPLLLCDAKSLTTARTAATTAVAVEELAPAHATRLAIIGSGPVARAHLHYVKNLRDWQEIRLYSPRLATESATRQAELRALDPRLQLCTSQEEAVVTADVILLCTSSAGPVLDPLRLGRNVLVTSISTNAPRAHEVPPASLAGMDVYCDYRATTPGAAGEMVLASESGWNRQLIRGDLPELVSGLVAKPTYERPVFFRSIGLGLEDMALANALHQLPEQGQ
ncbi:ornithine cyclodeaminase family protein [Aquipseudomonas alcaligenes]|uniref:NAD(P)H-dependent anabolic L-arginine dehydrogenase DauB n=1 Tax=Aquipseudomonas alcaligenes TaxID=43263 RepID=A0AA37FK34_AQUAC|nr:ornithine cyclodeaminase family protein [Pseudomonas alcaligenes]BCR25768.1 NAD(P)H-dependent anabolic L-arginine dehydrogenase DauB [Pseudomonas alcaligenes]GIZ66317.1 NAD(P)H-dependent anabolic L-arginine dehydrogenase DauB [Pseudomonas alcaligenes]GIZ70650.1 NAD(P)H-dependent anabolic L-arginine dehydrogenase DauB [Pseudomonas alcaligenes]GIZ75004.1 NAD(P)H-dependent anabolic L-arginine dehydrogenase DauB [Pseudomonas alcaligenes]GIZ79331.1 NAD(P)H-dependent anabolic L-arginine dehydroge